MPDLYLSMHVAAVSMLLLMAGVKLNGMARDNIDLCFLWSVEINDLFSLIIVRV